MPHSGIPGSTPACGSPRLIAANHALLRFLAPRHPPCALSSLTIKPLPTNGLQVEGQGSVQEPWFGSTISRRELPPRRFKNRACDLRSSVTIASTSHYSIFKVREVPRRGLGIIAISQLASSYLTVAVALGPLVEEMGLEPTTLGLQSRCSTS